MTDRFWPTFSAAPHRMFFFGGALQLLLTVAWWALDLAGRFNGWIAPIDWHVPASRAHPFLMVFGAYTFFFFGFVMTAGPRWLNVSPPERSRYIAVWAALSSGVLLFYLGLLLHLALAGLGVALMMLGLGLGAAWWWQAIARSGAIDRWHSRLIAASLSLGFLAMVLYALALWNGDAHLFAMSFSLGLWGMILPVFTTVCHRMVPFFSAGVLMNYDPWRPRWLLFALVGGQWAHGLADLASLNAWTWLIDFPLAVLGAVVTWRWQLRRSLSVPLLAMLHVGFAWFAIAMVLAGTNSVTMLTQGNAILGLAPVHALGIGFASSLVLAMVSRVSLGHSGRPLIAGKLVWGLFWFLQAVVLTRIAGEWLPGAAGPAYVLAAVLWLLCFGVWVWKFGPMYLRPRLDGQAG